MPPPASPLTIRAPHAFTPAGLFNSECHLDDGARILTVRFSVLLVNAIEHGLNVLARDYTFLHEEAKRGGEVEL